MQPGTSGQQVPLEAVVRVASLFVLRWLRIVLLAGLLAACSSGAQEVRVTQAEFGDEWPFSVPDGTLRCEGSGGSGAVTFEAQGRLYGVNGTAKSKGLPGIEPIWVADPAAPGLGLKKSVGPIIDRGLQLCQ